MNHSPELRRRWKIILWMSPWTLSAIICAYPYPLPLALFYAWAFPLGLLAFLPHNPNFTTPWWLSIIPSWLIIVAVWLPYVWLSIRAFKQKGRVGFFLFFAILIVLLALNVAGCRVAQQHLFDGMGC